ncbi:MAG: ABC transporter ATP-binding protein [Oscillospiraceae bacterium]|nr:ABC transporter ATP-binding protein [Oscillospiraceae bacterium]
MILKTTDVCRDFLSGGETIHALSNVNIEVQPGTLTMLRGRSGSGKTTLLNILGALDHPTSGEVYFEDERIDRISEHRRDAIRRTKMGFIFQSVALIANMSAYENVEFGLRLSGYPAAERRARAEECLELIGLGKRMTHRAQELSGGEQQRVAIARAMAHNPSLIFADEPTAELDTQMGLIVVRLFKEMIEKQGLTILMTTHDPNMIELADHVYELQDGVIVSER